MARTLSRLPRHTYRDRSRYKDLYEPIDSVPDGLRWKPSIGSRPGDSNVTVMLSTPGNLYRLIRDRNTGEVVYYRRKDFGPDMTPKEKIDAEPKRKGQARYRVGALCWFIDIGHRWYMCEVVARVGEDRYTFGEPKRIIIKSKTGWDADRQVQWPYSEELEFPALPDSPIFRRLRPLRDRYQ